MSKIDYQGLREKAEKATCGVWSLEYGEGRFDGDDALIHREAAGYIPICRIEGAHPESGFDEDFQMEQQANAEFIAAANPATVLALLDELETAKKRIAEQEAEPVSQTYKLNELSGNSPVTPDGWISCSERMPEMGERQCYVLAADFKNNYPPNIPNTQVGVYGDWFNDGNPTWDDGDGEDLYLKEVTHWMPLPEPPRLKEL
ncbi:TPA: ead/Ea22-like family protein [Escherichia coli]|uniref:ead/Ea22-like family protein n=1 Tax=Escherichia coli TaxID=562 RepID=UPI001C14A97C|nr:ead/Ea22-like family protein [Escherichia coli]HBE4909875.1 ead/Ea22-like family protein [Escherichia coli]HDL3618062.1 ead/Ea22-like family protein [Escherichia coli]